MKRKIVLSLLPIFLHFTIAQISNDRVITTFIFGIVSFIIGIILKSKKELAITIIAYFSFGLLMGVFEGISLLRFFLITKIFFLISIFIGFYAKKHKILIIVFPILFSVFMLFGYKNYLSLILDRGSIINKKLPNIELYNDNLEKIEFNQKDKVYVLDFWSTSCGICIKKFPDFEKTVLKYKNNPKVIFYAVNIPVRKETINDNITLTKTKYNYKFNKLYAKNKATCDSLGFHTFPTLIIIKNNKIYYQGTLILDKDIYVHHIETEIKRVLKIKN